MAKQNAMREILPYQSELDQINAQTQGEMQVAQMQAKAQLAMQMMEQENAKRQALELQRRSQLGDDYSTKQQYYYQYGI